MMVATTLLARQHHYILISNGLIFLQLIMQYTHKKTNNWKFTILIIQLGIIIKIETDKRIVSFTAGRPYTFEKNINIIKIQKYDITFEFKFQIMLWFPYTQYTCLRWWWFWLLPAHITWYLLISTTHYFPTDLVKNVVFIQGGQWTYDQVCVRCYWVGDFSIKMLIKFKVKYLWISNCLLNIFGLFILVDD